MSITRDYGQLDVKRLLIGVDVIDVRNECIYYTVRQTERNRRNISQRHLNQPVLQLLFGIRICFDLQHKPRSTVPQPKKLRF